MTTRILKFTDARSFQITDEDWGLIAYGHNYQEDPKNNCASSAHIYVLQHDDRRVIIHGIFELIRTTNNDPRLIVSAGSVLEHIGESVAYYIKAIGERLELLAKEESYDPERRIAIAVLRAIQALPPRIL